MLRIISIQNGSLQLSMLIRYVMVIWIGEFRWQSLIMRVRESMRQWAHLSVQVCCDIVSKMRFVTYYDIVSYNIAF